jgi:alkylhydroperoxidase/carboxymuconolactone decarboxylase family protein YurZ
MPKNETDKEQALRQAFQMHRDKMNKVRRLEEIRNSIKNFKAEFKETAQSIILIETEFNKVMTKASEGLAEKY